MQLSLHADYALRVLIYCGTHPERVVTTREISEAYGVSKNHLVRVAQTLGELGYLELIHGRSGGLRLKRDPAQIRLGDVVREAEPNLRLVECFDRETNTCPITRNCGLKDWLGEALDAFLNTLNTRTLADLLTEERRGKLATTFVQIRAQATNGGAKREGSTRPESRR